MLYQRKNSIGTFYFEYIRYHNFHFESHMHRHPELIYVESGELTLHLQGKTITVPAGTYAWIPSNWIHAYETKDTSEVGVCIFSEDFVPVFAKEVRARKPDTVLFTCRSSVDAFVRAELFVEDAVPDIYTLKAALYAVAGEILSQIHFEKASAKNEIVLDRIVSYVAEHFCEDITLRKTADALGYEVHYLSKLFHAEIPMHFSHYVNLYRVDAATELLQRNDLTIAEIAAASGFQSVRTFNRVFLDITGKTPGQYYAK